MQYTNFIILFILIVGSLRLVEVLIADINHIRGNIYSRWTVPVLAIFYTLMAGATFYEHLSITRKINYWVIVSGFLLLISRLAIKYWAVKTLNKNWSPHIEIRENHQLITTGPYRYVRHPAYLSAIMEIAAFPLVANTYYTFFVFTFLYVIFILFRIRFEENILLKNFGTEYEKYCRNTPLILPVIFM